MDLGGKMIKYVGHKCATDAHVSDILSESKEKNHYTNNGPVKIRLERTLEDFLSIDDDKRIACFNNGTSALHALMFLCKKKYNIKKWAIPSFNFPSAVVGGAFDVDVLDVSIDTYTLDMSKDLLAPYDAIIITNLFGSYVDLVAWERFCSDNGKILIFDNASSPLSEFGGRNISNFGHYTFSSLHHTKLLGFGEGGFAVVGEDEYFELNGIGEFGYVKNREHDLMSSNFKISDVSSAYILSHVLNFPINKYMEIQYDIVKKLSQIEAAPFNYKPGTVYGNLPILFDKKISTDSFQEVIEAKKYYKPLLGFENSLNIYNRIINLPLHFYLDNDDIGKIINSIKEHKA